MTKLTVHSVLGEGEKILLEIPPHMRQAITIYPGMILDLDQVALWDDIGRAFSEYQEEKKCKAFAARNKRWYQLIYGDAVRNTDNDK